MYSEAQLTTLVRQRDPQAFHFLYDKYSGAFYSFIRQLIPEKDSQAIILEQVFKGIFDRIDEFDPSKSRLFTWMLQLTREYALEKLDRQSVHLPNNVSNKNGLGELVDQLDHDQAKLIRLTYFRGITIKELAKQLNVPEAIIKSKIKHALIQLKTLF